MGLTKRASVLFLAFLVVTGVSGGCSAEPRTEVLVSVTTDHEVPAELDTLAITVSGPTMEIQTARADLTSLADLPRTVGLVHEGGPLGPFEATIVGSLSSGEQVASRRVRFAFQKGRTLALEIHLARACATVSCAGDETCADGVCRSIDVGPDELVPWPVSDGGVDAGVVDSAADTTDVGPSDAVPDVMLPTCDSFYSTQDGYEGCAEGASECEFHVTPPSGVTCAEICATAGESCVESFDPGSGVPNRCRRSTMRACDASFSPAICVCSRTP
jgi:hypothetical protein